MVAVKLKKLLNNPYLFTDNQKDPFEKADLFLFVVVRKKK